MTGREVPRSVQAMIVRDLARGYRTTDSIAQRHHVPPAVVVALRNEHGPRSDDLIRAAGELDRPAKAASKVEAPKPPIGNTDGLTVAERATARAWARTTGRTASAAGPISRALVAEWDAAGRPTAAHLAPAKPETVPDATEPASEPVEPVAAAAEVASDPVEKQEAAASAWAAPAEAPAVAASVGCDIPANHIPADVACAICDACGDALVADCCPACEAEGEQLAARRADDLDRFCGECLQVPALAEHCHAVAHAVERLRDARAEHEHRESLVQRVRAAIQPQGLHLTVEQVRLILAAVDEVA